MSARNKHDHKPDIKKCPNKKSNAHVDKCMNSIRFTLSDTRLNDPKMKEIGLDEMVPNTSCSDKSCSRSSAHSREENQH